MGHLGVSTIAPPVADLRAALAMNEWISGAERMRRTWTKVRVTPRGISGATGPAFSTKPVG